MERDNAREQERQNCISYCHHWLCLKQMVMYPRLTSLSFTELSTHAAALADHPLHTAKTAEFSPTKHHVSATPHVEASNKQLHCSAH